MEEQAPDLPDIRRSIQRGDAYGMSDLSIHEVIPIAGYKSSIHESLADARSDSHISILPVRRLYDFLQDLPRIGLRQLVSKIH